MQLDIVSKHRNTIYGFLALWIVIFHGKDINGIDYSFGRQSLAWLIEFISRGNVAVDVFLLLSGISLYFSFQKSPKVIPYLKKRMLRLFVPVFIICGPCWLILAFIYHASASELLLRMLTLQFWIDGDQAIWYVSIAVVLYLLYPLIYKFLFSGTSSRGTCIRALILMAATYAGVILISIFLPNWYAQTEIALTRVPIFIFGCWMGKAVYEKKKVPWIYALDVILAAIVFFGMCNLRILQGMALRFFYLIGGVSMAYLLAILFDGIAKVKVLRYTILNLLQFLGSFSLELYLSHIMLNELYESTPIYSDSLSGYIVVVILAIVYAYDAMRLREWITRSNKSQDQEVLEEPILEESVVEEPITEVPITETPISEEPISEEPALEEPVSEEPVPEESVLEASVVEEPILEAPLEQSFEQ